MSGGNRVAENSIKGHSLQLLTLSVLKLCSGMMSMLERVSDHESRWIELQIVSMVATLVRLNSQSSSRNTALEMIKIPEYEGWRGGRPRAELSQEVILLLRQLEDQMAVASIQQSSSAERLAISLQEMMQQVNYNQADLNSTMDVEQRSKGRIVFNETERQRSEGNVFNDHREMANLHAPDFFEKVTVRAGQKTIVKFLRI